MVATAAPFALRSFEYWLFQYKRTWRGSVISTILFPVLFLASMGLGLGTLVDSSTSGGVWATATSSSSPRDYWPRRRCRPRSASRPTR